MIEPFVKYGGVLAKFDEGEESFGGDWEYQYARKIKFRRKRKKDGLLIKR